MLQILTNQVFIALCASSSVSPKGEPAVCRLVSSYCAEHSAQTESFTQRQENTKKQLQQLEGGLKDQLIFIPFCSVVLCALCCLTLYTKMKSKKEGVSLRKGDKGQEIVPVALASGGKEQEWYPGWCMCVISRLLPSSTNALAPCSSITAWMCATNRVHPYDFCHVCRFDQSVFVVPDAVSTVKSLLHLCCPSHSCVDSIFNLQPKVPRLVFNYTIIHVPKDQTISINRHMENWHFFFLPRYLFCLRYLDFLSCFYIFFIELPRPLMTVHRCLFEVPFLWQGYIVPRYLV